MAGDNFVHLHVHTEYSMLDGAARVKELFDEAARMEMPALAMTDHGNLFGTYEFFKAGKAAGVKPITGIEAYYVPIGTRHDRAPFSFGGDVAQDVGDEGAGKGKVNYTHMTMWAETTEGLHNLFRMSSLASLEGQYRRYPRMDRELLAQHGKGIIATTGCPSGEVNRWLQAGQYDQALAAAATYQEILGKDNFFCELMDHGIAIERRTRDDLISIAKTLNLPFVATNDLHYTYAKDADAHEALLCVQTGRNLSDPNRFKFDARDFYLKSAAEMRNVWSEFPEACDNTLLIAERCNVEFGESRNLMPRFPVPDGYDEGSWLVEEVTRGLRERFAPDPVPQSHLEQAAYELSVVQEMGFPGYFLVVADLVRYAKQEGIRVGPGRGSAAGAIVAWALGITELDPIKFGLLFERFLNPERVSMPDIDMDFDERRRGDMIRYATEKYGEERVAQIVTYSTIKAKAALKDAARVLGMPFQVGEKLTKAMPPAVMGKDVSLSGIFDPQHDRYKEAADFRTLYETDPDAKQVVDTARGLEGLRRQWGVHAAGVILSAEPLIDVIPIMRRDQDGAIITQLDMGACESLGLLKMDFLGLRNLTVLDDALAHIKANRGEAIVLEDLELDDAATYELLSRGDTLGVFQLDGGPMRSLLRSMQPNSFDDISAVLALYRPGPMGANAHNDYADYKNKRKPMKPIHPELTEPLAEILDETYGVIVYQEQVQAIAQKVAGYSLGQADLLRRAMGKKKKEILDKEYVPFSKGMKEHGYSEDAIQTLWDILVPFSDYAFNKAHTAGYGLVSYWTAYLKANYGPEYMAALLSSVKDDKDKLAVYLHECRRMGIQVLPPDVNESVSDFAPVGGDIRFGLTAVRNVGSNVVDSIISTRKAKGAYTSFTDFLAKVDAIVCNKRTIESLIKAGAFDSLGHARRALVNVHAEAVDSVLDTKRAEAIGQFDLFGGFGDEADTDSGGITINIGSEEWEKSVQLAAEREMLGLYVSAHALFGVEHILRAGTDCSIADVHEDHFVDAQVVTVGGLVTALQRKVTKQGSAWAIATVEDLEGGIEVMLFPQTYQTVGAMVNEDTVIFVRGRVDKSQEGAARLVAMDVSLPDLATPRSGPLVIQLPVARCVPQVIDQLKDVLNAYPGTTEVRLKLLNGSRTTVMRIDDTLRVSPSTALYGDLKALLGPGCLA
mgnify:FL=1